MNSNKPSAPAIIRQLDEVVSGIRSFAERERGLERARQLRDSNRRQSLAEEEAALRREQDLCLTRLKEEAEAAMGEVSRVGETRKTRIDKAQIAVRNQVISAIQQSEGQRVATLQRNFMKATRAREKALAAATARREEQSALAASLNSRLLRVEKAAAAGLRGFRYLQRRFIEELKQVDAGDLGEGTDPPAPDELEERCEFLQGAVRDFRRLPLVSLYNGIPIVLQIFFVLLAGGAVAFVLNQTLDPVPVWASYEAGLGAAALLSVLLLVGFASARRRAGRFLKEVMEPLAASKRERLRLRLAAEERLKEEKSKIETAFQASKKIFEEGISPKGMNRAGGGSAGSRYTGPDEVEERAAQLRETLAELQARRLKNIEHSLEEQMARVSSEFEEQIAALKAGDGSVGGEGKEDLEKQFRSLVAKWEETLVPAHRALIAAAAESVEAVWLRSDPEQWSPPKEFSGLLPFGELFYQGEENDLPVPKSEEMPLAGEVNFRLPLRLRVPEAASLLLETRQSGREEAVSFLNALSLGWLASAPAGRLSFSFFDPVGLGESFAGLMHLADYEELLINSRIRTRADQIEQRLGELCDHMEKVIQMYLRSDFETITQYNEAAGTIAERYHFVVAADFPKGFTDLATQRLLSIASSGARCGVFLLLHRDEREELPRGFSMDDVRQACLCLRSGPESFFLKDNPVTGTGLSLILPPPPELFSRWVHRIGEFNRDSNRIEVPFSFIAPGESERWSSSTAKELSVPVGRSGATKLQSLALGKGTCQHALIAGKTGSGKSTLFHIIVTNLALWCDPDEVEFYLIDFKKGVEFKCYADAQLPHARVIAIESDREFGLSVLSRLDEELKRRGELFRAVGVQDVAGYRGIEGSGPMPRTLLLIDEFQEFFTQDDQVSQQAAVLLDRIVRQGRAFGIHAILGSQTLGGAFTLARATLGQMTVRIALACNEADSYLIMDDSNPAPRLLTRPGEGIYNDRAGAVEANSPFQVVWLDETERNRYLAELREEALARGKAGGSLVVFEGNAPGDITRDATVAAALAAAAGGVSDGPPKLFLGAPNAIKGATEVRFERQSGSHLLVVGQRDDVVDVITATGLSVLRRQWGEKVRLVLVDSRFFEPGDSSWFCEAVRAVGGVECPDARQFGETVNALAAEMKRLANGEDAPASGPVFLFVPSLQRHKKLRFEEDFSFSLDEEGAEAKPSSSLNELILDGPGWGFHIVTSLDSFNNVNRCLGRKAAGEFEKKVLFQMSAADSAALVDSGAASDLGLNRALFYDEPTGVLEIFRPYAPPPLDWFGGGEVGG